jgi:hypothetical protein
LIWYRIAAAALSTVTAASDVDILKTAAERAAGVANVVIVYRAAHSHRDGST